MLRADCKALFLAIDAGTTKIKASLVESDGTIIDLQSEDVKVHMPVPGACELDMNTVWHLVSKAIYALKENNEACWHKICAIGVCAQGDGIWPIDKTGTPVRNAILWNDTRKESLEGLDMDIVNHTCLASGTTSLFSGATPILLRYIKNYEPKNYSKIDKVLHCKDWINYNLTGTIVTDVTDASTALLNIYTKKYEYKILDILGISESANMFPEVVDSQTIIGTVRKDIAELFCFNPKTPVIAGSIDVLAVATGCAIVFPGQKGSIIGTTLCNYVVLDEQGARENTGNIGSVLCHTKSGTYIRLMASLSGASSLDWMRREILGDENFETLEAEMKKISVGSGGVLYHPYLYGERAPFAHPGATGGFYGIRNHHTKYHMAKSAYEGVALSMFDCYKSLPHTSPGICIAGGATKSDYICQMISDCMGETATRYAQKELGILGICFLLRTAFSFEEEISKKNVDVFEPDLLKHSQYTNIYEDFKALRLAIAPFWDHFRKRQ